MTVGLEVKIQNAENGYIVELAVPSQGNSWTYIYSTLQEVFDEVLHFLDDNEGHVLIAKTVHSHNAEKFSDIAGQVDRLGGDLAAAGLTVADSCFRENPESKRIEVKGE